MRVRPAFSLTLLLKPVKSMTDSAEAGTGHKNKFYSCLSLVQRLPALAAL